MDWGLFQNQANQVLGEEFWSEIASLLPNTGPRVDIYYTSSAVVVLAEIPGLRSQEQIRIFLEGQQLIIEGDIPRIYPVPENRVTLKERFFGNFRRALALPKIVSPSGMKANYSEGLLMIELPIEADEQQNYIPIEFT